MIHVPEGFSNRRVCIFQCEYVWNQGLFTKPEANSHNCCGMLKGRSEDLGTRNLDSDYNVTNSKLHNQLIDNTKTSEYSKSVIEMLLCMRNVCAHTCVQVHTHISAYVYYKNYVCACSCMHVFLHFALKEPRIICDPAVGKSLTVSAQI